MSLPAGASITSIGGRRCTAIPRAAAAGNGSNFPATSEAVAVVVTATSTPTLPTEAAVAKTSNTPAPVESSSPIVQVAAEAGHSTISLATSPPVELTSSTQLPSSIQPSSVSPSDSTQNILSAAQSSTSQVEVAPLVVSATHALPTSLQTSSNFSTNTPSASAESNESSIQIPTSQSPYAYSYQAVATTSGYASTTQVGESPVQPSAAPAASVSPSPQANVGSMVGGVVGGISFIGILFFIWWRFFKRKKSRDSLLTPLTGSFDRRTQMEKYEFDGDSVGPTPLGERWKAQAGGFCSRLRMNLVDLGLAAKAKFSRESDAPSVNMNRGNSQFLEPIQQHSRSNSAVSGAHETVLTTRDRFADWWQRLTEDINFNWRLRQKANEPLDNLAATRSMDDGEFRANAVSPDFSQFLVMKDNELRQGPERHRRSQSTATLPQLGSLGLEFGSGLDPFADPFPNAQPTIPNISKPKGAMTSNPFADPAPKVNTSDYISNVRRSRGLSQPIPRNSAPATRLPFSHAASPSLTPRYPSVVAPSSRYPSTIRTSQASSRDTVLSELSISGRKAKGRSDPFDLDRPDLLRLPPPVPSQSQTEKNQRSKETIHPRIESVHADKPRIVSNAETYSSSKYSSGVSAIFSDWGDPGPDIGPMTWRKPGAEEVSVGSNGTTRGSTVSTEFGSQIITVGRAL